VTERPELHDMVAVVLCGGMGTRFGAATQRVPKPMITVGDHPILWHIVRYYASFGVSRFVLCLGYKAEVIRQWVDDDPIAGVSITCVDTGATAMTGTRVKRVQHLIDDDTFLLTYGDGVADVDLDALVAHHHASDAVVTLTGVHPPARFGVLAVDGDHVVQFQEKPRSADWINGGFFVCDRDLFTVLDDGDDCVLERTPFETLAARRRMQMWRHEGFWQCMDTVADREVLEQAWSAGAPWVRW
jgi:glucose-1-phosphate cytidylyltransferase